MASRWIRHKTLSVEELEARVLLDTSLLTALTLAGAPALSGTAAHLTSDQANRSAETAVTAATQLSAEPLYPKQIASQTSVLPHSPAQSLNNSTAHTYRARSMLYLDNGTVRVGLNRQWGGAISEIRLNGVNFVNAYDPGRLIQVAAYDGNASYDSFAAKTGQFGWNPVQGGDKYRHGSPLVEYKLGPDYIYIKTRPLQWNPHAERGKGHKPVLSDVFVEQWVSFVPQQPQVIKVSYRLTHFGQDDHAYFEDQEFPAVYVNKEYQRFIYYGGTNPWANDPVTVSQMPRPGQPVTPFYAPEMWGSLVGKDDIGLTVFMPDPQPYIVGLQYPAPGTGPRGQGTNNLRFISPFTLGRNAVVEGDMYLIPGDYKEARKGIYDLRQRIPIAGKFEPIAVVDSPQRQQKVSGTLDVHGWAFGSGSISQVDVYIDGVRVGAADYGLPRGDVKNTYPNAPADIGFSYGLDSKNYPNGSHRIEVRIIDGNGRVSVLPAMPISIEN